MKFLKSYTGAMVVMTVVILLSVLLGSHRSLTAERAKIEARFYEGDGSGWSIATDLGDCVDIAANVLSVAERYLNGSELEALTGSRSELEASLDPDSRYYSIANASRGYQRLTAEAGAVLDRLEGCTLSEKDAQYVRGFRADLAARADTIARDPYSQQAETFNQTVLGAFPANLLSRITFVREAEVFGVD